MNTKPDEETLALWLDDEMENEDFAAVETWVISQPELIAVRSENRRWRETMFRVMPASEEPPYPDFFNHRVMQAIRVQPLESSTVREKLSFSWKNLFIPAAACAGMILTFWVGKNSKSNVEPEFAIIPRAIPVKEPVLYTPESGVGAEWFSSKEASASVIVLNGVAAIPDTTEFTETALLWEERDIDSTAQSELKSAVEPPR